MGGGCRCGFGLIRWILGEGAHAERCCGVPLRPAELKGAHSHTHRCPRLSGRGQRVRGHGGAVSRGVGPGGRSGGGGLGGHGAGGGDCGEAGVEGDRAGAGGGFAGALGLGGGLGGGAAGAVAAVDRLLGHAEGGADRVPGEAEGAVEVHGGGDQGLDAVPQLLGQAHGGGGGPAVDDEAGGGAGAAGAVDVAQLGGEGAERVHLAADPLDVPHQQVQAGPCLCVVGCVVGHEQASRTGGGMGGDGPLERRPVEVNSP
ncbi:hypothetical protein CCOS2040_02885 [Streptomyces albidoflavus]|nr:hypothetical protein CCOS2040_02885 [Streptomyces albidoflavus]